MQLQGRKIKRNGLQVNTQKKNIHREVGEVRIARCDHCKDIEMPLYPDVLITIHWLKFEEEDVEIDLCESCGKRAYDFLKKQERVR